MYRILSRLYNLIFLLYQCLSRKMESNYELPFIHYLNCGHFLCMLSNSTAVRTSFKFFSASHAMQMKQSLFARQKDASKKAFLLATPFNSNSNFLHIICLKIQVSKQLIHQLCHADRHVLLISWFSATLPF